MSARDPLTGPFKTAHQILSSTRDPAYPIRLPVVPEGASVVTWTLARLGYAARDEKAAA